MSALKQDTTHIKWNEKHISENVYSLNIFLYLFILLNFYTFLYSYTRLFDIFWCKLKYQLDISSNSIEFNSTVFWRKLKYPSDGLNQAFLKQFRKKWLPSIHIAHSQTSRLAYSLTHPYQIIVFGELWSTTLIYTINR